jgi:hypothetical protein
MGMRTIVRRIEQAEEKLKARYIFLRECICFPEKEPPFFCEPSEEEIAAQVKCPLHGERFKRPQFSIYVASWLRAKEPARRERLSAQYRKAWDASFPAELNPPVPKPETTDGVVNGDRCESSQATDPKVIICSPP